MLDNSSKKDIQKISFDLLKSSKALGILPTPVDHIVNHTDLTVSKNGLTPVDPSIFEMFSELLKSGLDKVRGVLDRSQKTIYLNTEQDKKQLRKNFVTLHEVGHDLLPWQSQTMAFLDDDETLDPDTEEQFEAEANYFASLTLFQHDVFNREMDKLELGIKSPLALSKQFGASFHSTIRRYVEQSKKRIALLVLKDISSQSMQPVCFFRNYFQSKKFSKEFGEITWPEKFGFTWNFVPLYYQRRRLVEDGTLNLTTKGGDIDFRFHFFCNGYNAFVLILPKGEKNRTRTTILISR